MSNETKWTPGPWEYNPETVPWESDPGSARFLATIKANGKNISIFKIPPTDADGRMMAQAPRMYEALEKAVGCLEINMVNACDGMTVDEMKQIMAAARGEK